MLIKNPINFLLYLTTSTNLSHFRYLGFLLLLNFLIACFYVSAGKSSTLEYATRVTPKYGFETKNSTSISPEAYRLHAIPNQFFKNLGAPLGSSI